MCLDSREKLATTKGVKDGFTEAIRLKQLRKHLTQFEKNFNEEKSIETEQKTSSFHRNILCVWGMWGYLVRSNDEWVGSCLTHFLKYCV